MESSSSSKTIIVETIVTENYRTGYTYSMHGPNVQPAEGTIISPGTRIGRGVFVGYKKHIQADIEDYICYMVEGQEPAITRVYQ